MGPHAEQHHLGIDEYVEHERHSPVKHEYAGGQLHAMDGASERHNRIALNLAVHLHGATRGSDCSAYMSDMKLRIDAVVYYPDVMVCCDPADADPYLKHSPCLVIEVLDESTEVTDRGRKLHAYLRIPALRAYLLVSQEQRRVEILRRAEGPNWLYRSHEADDAVIELPCPESRLTIAQVYERVGI